ncbi:MAG: tetratricopeptide repeat protein [Candidatus Omnitrophica bacterium]|nr:tetratricopeptide repeat protein [Candidatus Omnitrophota bacterium]
MFEKLSRCVFVFICAILFIYDRAQALDKKESFALSHYIMGVMYEDLGDVDKAIEEYQKAAKADSGTTVIHVSLASGYIKKNNIPRAIEELKMAIAIDPETIEPHAILAILYSSENKLDLATVEYERALKSASKLEPKNAGIYKGLGAIYLQQRKLKDAENAYRLITELAPDDSEAHFYLGSIYNELKNNALAEKELKRAIELRPDYAEALNFLGYVYVELGRNLGRAETMIKKALSLDPDNGAYIDSLGWLYFKKGKFPEALTELSRAAALIDDPVIFDHLGDTYLKLNLPQKARQSFESSLKLDPNQDLVKRKIEKIK